MEHPSSCENFAIMTVKVESEPVLSISSASGMTGLVLNTGSGAASIFNLAFPASSWLIASMSALAVTSVNV